MKGRLRTLGPDGMYRASGSLDGLSAGRRWVSWLEVGRVDAATAEEGLAPLMRFPDLSSLELSNLVSVDLEPLTELELSQLRIGPGSDLDLAPLARVPTESLLLLDLDARCRVPERLRLSTELQQLMIVADHPNASPRIVKQIVEAIDWAGLANLRYLHLRVGGNHELEPIKVNLSLLRNLTRLERADLDPGVWHTGPDPSPLEPPFEGLPTTLTWLRFDAWDPEPIEHALRRYLPRRDKDGNQVAVSVIQRYPYERHEPWEITEHDGRWSVYGSLFDMPIIADAPDPAEIAATEWDALQVAQARLRAADPALLDRLDFDQESSGTGIEAPTRDDLQRALRFLGLPSACPR